VLEVKADVFAVGAWSVGADVVNMATAVVALQVPCLMPYTFINLLLVALLIRSMSLIDQQLDVFS
jgi:hypothetical protein